MSESDLYDKIIQSFLGGWIDAYGLLYSSKFIQEDLAASCRSLYSFRKASGKVLVYFAEVYIAKVLDFSN